MKRAGILNADLSGHIARLGHTDRFLVVDAGFPVPAGVPVVDLRLVFGIPRFSEVLTAVLSEVVVEDALVAAELADANPATRAVIDAALDAVRTVSHEELKQLAAAARFAARSAEDTPYSNVLLTAGVAFDV